MRQDAVYQKDKAELGKLNYLLASLFVFAVGASIVLFAVAEAAARLGRMAARPGAAPVPRSGTHKRTEKRRPSTSAVS